MGFLFEESKINLILIGNFFNIKQILKNLTWLMIYS